MADVKGTGGAGHGDIDHHVALLQQVFVEALALATHDESHILGELGVVNTSSVVGRFDGYDGLALGDDLTEVGLFGEIPLDVAATGGGGATYFAQAMTAVFSDKHHF